MTVYNPNDLIGDFIGTIPAMQALPAGTEFIIKHPMAELLELARLPRCNEIGADKAFDLHGAFALADKKQLHMNQANFHFVGLPVPEEIPRAKLYIKPEVVPVFDYVLAPFSRSLPPEQKWDHWQSLVNAMPDKKFALLGNSTYDGEGYVTGDNVTPIFNRSMNYVSNVLLQSGGLISGVTGISHLAFALGVKNWLFFEQGTWAKSPEAILLPMSTTHHDLIAML